MVQHIFPHLAAYPVERFEFFTLATSMDERALITNESWSGFADNPQERLLVRVTHGPGDAKRRE